MLRVALSRPVTFLLFLALSFWPASLLADMVPFGPESLAMVTAVALAAALASAHVRTSGRFRDAGAYFFWVYAVAILFAVAGQLLYVAFGAAFVTEPGYPLGEAALVFVVYATAWWLVYHDGWARVRPLNWGSDGRGGSKEA